jgi:hypothetical protein
LICVHLFRLLAVQYLDRKSSPTVKG